MKQPATTAPDCFALVPLIPNAEMNAVMSAGDWQWADLLAAAGAITLEQYDAIGQAEPATTAAQEIRGVVRELTDDERAAVEFYRLNPTAAVFDLGRRTRPATTAAGAEPVASADDEEHPTNRYLFKYLCEVAGIELGVDRVDAAISKAAALRAARAAAPQAARPSVPPFGWVQMHTTRETGTLFIGQMPPHAASMPELKHLVFPVYRAAPAAEAVEPLTEEERRGAVAKGFAPFVFDLVCARDIAVSHTVEQACARKWGLTLAGNKEGGAA